ncbi:MAG: hypothetical protein II697_03595 [Clostridia bacterium]|nr:hypothetical protein [Clostridia bacterium]
MRFKLSWRMGVEAISDPAQFSRLLDAMTQGESAVDEIWIFIAEPTTNGYEPLEEIARKCELYKTPAAQARARGIRVGINPWPTFGAGESYMHDQGQAALPYPGMVGMDGSVSERIACPISPEFLEYTRQRYRLFAKAGCDFVWVDDDCRFTHLGGVPYPCFCPRCVQGFEGGRFQERKALVDALNAPENGELRRRWSAYGAQRLAAYCSAVRKAVDEIDPAIETPFMSVGYSHTTYSGNFIEACMRALRAKSARPGHGFYWDETPMELFDKAYEMSRQVCDMPREALDDVQYEEESCPMSPLNKAPNTRLFEMAIAVWGGCTGVAFNHLLNAGGPRPFDYLKYELSLLKRSRAMLDQYLSFTRQLPQAGLWGAYSPWLMSKMRVGDKGWFDEHRPEYAINRFAHEWPVFGIPVAAQREGSWGTLLQGRVVDAFTDEELRKLFSRPVFLDGEALDALWERGLGELAGARVKRAKTGGLEKLAASSYAGEFAGARRNAIFGKAYDLALTSPDTEVLAYTERPYGQKDEICAVKYHSAVTLGYNPYQYTGTPGHMHLMLSLCRELGAPLYLEPTDPYDLPRVAVFARCDETRAAVLLINAQTSSARDFDVCFTGAACSAQTLMPDTPPQHSALEASPDGKGCRLHVALMQPWEMRIILME